MMRVFVTGTDTDVGKTLVSAWLCRHFGLDYFKPVQAGLLPMTDSEWVKLHAGCHTYPEAYRLREPASPHYAARLEGVQLALQQIRLPAAQRLVVEGAGGVMVPLGAGRLMVDLIAWLGLPVLVVASTRLGTLNHTLLTLQALRLRGIAVLGVILNGSFCDMTARTLADYGSVPVLQQIPALSAGISASALMQIAPTAALKQALGALE
ncbi:MAG TPA: dethiobiotin synthase [Advenella sp.]|nr:dethiobiotin synthase [Advenella sp.]